MIVFLDVNTTQILHNDLNYDLILQLWGEKFFERVSLEWKQIQEIHVWKGYKSSNDEDGAENVILEGEQSQTHVGEDEILSQEVKHLKELHEWKHEFHH